MHLLYILAILCVFIYELRAFVRRRRYPPGPRGLPLLGNALSMPTKTPWIQFEKISKKYGPVISFNVAGQTVVVLNDHKSAFELLDRRGLNYSHRPRFIKAGELLAGGLAIGYTSYGNLFKKLRRVAHEQFSSRATEQFQQPQRLEAARLILDIIQHPGLYDDHLRTSVASSILSANYGWPRLSKAGIAVVKDLHAHSAHLAKSCLPGSSMVDLFPFINHLPLWMSKWKKDALDWHAKETGRFEGFLKDVEAKMVNGEAPNCFASNLIGNLDKHGVSLKEAAWLAGHTFVAGAETTIATLENFLIIMQHYPHMMRRAQTEIDKVVGRERPPTFSDRQHLPYMRALVKEVLRFRPAGPMGIPRRVAEDDWYNDCHIPKGAIIISNIWAINRDPELYGDPEEFRPERHLDATQTIDISPPDTHNLGHSTFGFGRRACIGNVFASQGLFINIAMFLWAFDIESVRDPAGKPILPSLTDVIATSITVGPVPFQCRLVPRCSDVQTVMERFVASQ